MSRKKIVNHFKMKIYVCFRSKIVNLNIMTFESSRYVLFVQEGICERIEN